MKLPGGLSCLAFPACFSMDGSWTLTSVQEEICLPPELGGAPCSHSLAQPVTCSRWVSYPITNLACGVQHAAVTRSAVVLFTLSPLLIILQG